MGIEQHGKLVELDLDRLGEVLGLGARRRHAHGDRFAHEPHLVVRQRMALRKLVVGQRGRRDDGGDAVEVGANEHLRLGAGRLDDAADAAMRDRAAQEGNLVLPGHHVRHEAAATVQMPRILLAPHPHAYALPRHVAFGHGPKPWPRRAMPRGALAAAHRGCADIV